MHADGFDRAAYAAFREEVARDLAEGQRHATAEAAQRAKLDQAEQLTGERAARALAVARMRFRPCFGRCEQHGEFALNELGADGVERWRPETCPACARQQGVRRLMRRAEIAPRFAGCDFEGFQATTPSQQHALETCRWYADHFPALHAAGVCLILRGNPGTGKNHLAVALSKAVMARGYTALHATAYEVINRLRDTWASRRPAGTEIETERQVIDQLAAVDLLVLDEIGRQYGSEGEQLHLFQVIDARYRALRPTVVISNLTAEAIRTYLGDAAFDRLREGGGKLLNFDWESYRGQVRRGQA